MIDSISYISSIPSGTMICDTIGSGTAFLIKEEQSCIHMILENNISIEIRSGLLILDDVGLVPFLIQINGNPTLTYHEWFNFYDDSAKQCFNDLATQELLHIIFFSEDINLARGISTSNNLLIAYKMFIQQLKNRVPWGMDDFEYAKSKMLRKYPSTISLWHGLKELGERK